jgi:hypothetical protein
MAHHPLGMPALGLLTYASATVEVDATEFRARFGRNEAERPEAAISAGLPRGAMETTA